MRFAYPHFPAEFEIPDDWWVAAGMPAFKRSGSAFVSRDDVEGLVALCDIEPPFRRADVAKDFRGFDRDRMIDVLTAIAAGTPLPSVPLLVLPPLHDISKAPFRYRLLDGLHRFYASVAAGFEALPCTFRECLT